MIWRKENSNTRKLRKSFEIVRIELTTLRVLVRMLLPYTYWKLYGTQGQNLIMITPAMQTAVIINSRVIVLRDTQSKLRQTLGLGMVDCV